MSNPRILIVGDSFAADWSVKYKQYKGWPNLLAEQYPTVNLAQAGVSEYKIYQQLLGVDLDNFDLIIVSHTSPLRVPTRRHPIHCNDLLHKDADLMFTDIEYHRGKLQNFFNASLKTAYKFFIHHFDVEYFETTYRLLRNQINEMLKEKTVIVISNLPDLEKFVTEKNVLNFAVDGGIINHASQELNKEIFHKVVETIEKLSTDTQSEE